MDDTPEWYQRKCATEDKLDLMLVPGEAVEAIAAVMMTGAKKHGAHSWRQHPMPWRYHVCAAWRHIIEIVKGHTICPDSGHYHVDHALAQLAIAAALIRRKAQSNDGTDGRPGNT